MALINKSPAFENMNEEDGAEDQAVSGVDRMKAAAAERESAAKPAPIAVAKPQAVTVHKAMVDPLQGLENAFPVEYDTLRNLIITNGNVMDKDTNKALGDIIGIELLSFQKSFVVSPGVEGDEAKELVRYSDDGVTTSQGEDCREYLAGLKAANYPNAKLTERSVICGSIFEPGKMKDLKDSLVQINLPPTSKAAFQRYRMDQAFQVGKGFIPAAGADRVKIECTLTTKGTNTWTVASFSRWAD